MEAHDEDLVKSLGATNPELKQAYEEHARLKAQVDGNMAALGYWPAKAPRWLPPTAVRGLRA